MTSFTALYAADDRAPSLIRLWLESRKRSRGVVIPATGSGDPAHARVTVRRPDGHDLTGLVPGGNANEQSLPISIDGEEQKLTVTAVAATGHVAFALSSGARGVVDADEGDTDVQGILGVDDVVLVAIVAIVAIAVMVSVHEGGDVLVQAGGVEVKAEGGNDGDRGPGGGS